MISYIVLVKILASLFIGKLVLTLFIVRTGKKKKIGLFTFLYYLAMFTLMAVSIWVNY